MTIKGIKWQNSNKINSNSFNEDIVDYISNINDNDIVGFVNSENGELIELNTEFINYAKLKNKKAKQLRSIIETKWVLTKYIFCTNSEDDGK